MFHLLMYRSLFTHRHPLQVAPMTCYDRVKRSHDLGSHCDQVTCSYDLDTPLPWSSFQMLWFHHPTSHLLLTAHQQRGFLSRRQPPSPVLIAFSSLSLMETYTVAAESQTTSRCWDNLQNGKIPAKGVGEDVWSCCRHHCGCDVCGHQQQRQGHLCPVHFL